MLLEIARAILDNALDLGEDSGEDFTGVARGDTGDVGGVCEGREGSTAQVDDVELYFLRRVDERERHDEGA